MLLHVYNYTNKSLTTFIQSTFKWEKIQLDSRKGERKQGGKWNKERTIQRQEMKERSKSVL